MSDQRAGTGRDPGQPATTGEKRAIKAAYACSFCGKKQEQVWRLIAGPGVYICDECVLLCMEMFVEQSQTSLDEDLAFRVAVQRPDGAAEQLSFGPLREPGYPTADHPAGERWLRLCPACGAVNVGGALTICLHCGEPLPRPGEPVHRPRTPWHIGFTRRELRSFTPPLRAALDRAADEARLLNHRYIGTEHLLLGLLRQSEGVAPTVLREQGLSGDALQQAVIDIIGRGSDTVTEVNGYSERARNVVRDALAEASAHGQPTVAPEHLLLALLAERRGVGAMALTALGIDLDATSRLVERRLRRSAPAAKDPGGDADS